MWRRWTLNISLQNHAAERLSLASRRARLDVADQTGLDLETFPEVCPWTIEQILDEGFLPASDRHRR
jgi:hypothetical protein